ncbi:MAG: putative zinc-binding metallopeptidase [Opitutales bacterium]
MRLFRCPHCSELLFFDNHRCLSCGTEVAFDRSLHAFLAVGGDGVVRCANAGAAKCNWRALPEHPEGLCEACAFNRTVPPLDHAEACGNWGVLEGEKRRLLAQLDRLGLWPPSFSEKPDGGLAFDFLQPLPDEPVTTGHADGVVTLNVSEGDPARREAMRLRLGEPYRTVLGHFRHEIGHYYWLRWSGDAGFLERCRSVFGDDREDYAASLQRHYESSPPADWHQHYISAYASAHAWEDWAESWAHLLHLLASLESAAAVGLGFPAASEAFFQNCPSIADPYDAEIDDFPRLLEGWFRLSCATNLLNRSVGQPDVYPFALSPEVTRKIGFIFEEIRRHREAGS